MTTRHILLVALAIAPMLLRTSAIAAEMTYTPAAFEAAHKVGKPILVHSTAPWCTTFAAQTPIFAKLKVDPKFQDLQLFDGEFDTRDDVVK
jgi:hypothetical protein